MENTIFHVRFLKKMMTAPTTQNLIHVYSTDMDTDLYGMDTTMYNRKRASLDNTVRPDIVFKCCADVGSALFYSASQDDFRSVTDEQFIVICELMEFLMAQKDSLGFTYHMYMDIILKLLVVLLASNKKEETEMWVKRFKSELTCLKTCELNTVLHQVIDIDVNSYTLEPIVKLLLEEGVLDVNVINGERQTPLHMVSHALTAELPCKPDQDLLRVGELLIYHGAHMDVKDSNKIEASEFFSQRFPKYAFKSSLKCLAAKAILSHGIKYEKYCASKQNTFIEEHTEHPRYVNEPPENWT